ncbi:MAG TPA: AsmA-like C-terminal region-containing protein [Vicinamibacterales bacterium]
MSVVTRRTSHVRDLVIDALNQRFRSQVELESLAVDAFPNPAISGSGLRLRHNGRTDVEPLITIESYSASAGLWALTAAPPLRLKTVELEGLDIRIPPGGFRVDPAGPEGVATTGTAGRPGSPTATEPPRRRWLPFRRRNAGPLAIDRIVARRATLELTPRDVTKLPRIFEIHDLEMLEFGGDRGAQFTASLTNPKPAGRIETSGTFGPWESDDPHLTPIEGQYTFKNADLNTIKGIAGILASEGRYRGALERIEVEGTTDTPDFRVDLAGTPVHLMTTFNAVVDGTNGNTWLERVDAQIGETLLKTKGAVVRAQDVKGRHISLDIAIEQGRIEDLLQLAVKSATPILTGRIDLKTRFLLPAGEQSVVEKLQLDGAFTLAQARFTNVDVQEKITLLSQKGRGDEVGNDGESVVSDLQGRFVMERSALRFSNLRFAVPGAIVQLAGTYDLRSEQMDFRGELLTDASLADMTSGVKSVLARMAQPFFRRKGGGSTFPILISGPRSKPSFGLDVKRAFLPG